MYICISLYRLVALAQRYKSAKRSVATQRRPIEPIVTNNVSISQSAVRAAAILMRSQRRRRASPKSRRPFPIKNCIKRSRDPVILKFLSSFSSSLLLFHTRLIPFERFGTTFRNFQSRGLEINLWKNNQSLEVRLERRFQIYPIKIVKISRNSLFSHRTNSNESRINLSPRSKRVSVFQNRSG